MTFLLTITEPLVGEKKTMVLPIDSPGKPLHKYIGGRWKDFAECYLDGFRLACAWQFLYPIPGAHFELRPHVAIKVFSDAFIKKLNADYEGGELVKAIVLTESISPLVQRYFVDSESPIFFDGHEYMPLGMSWSGMDVSSQMTLPSMQIAVINVSGEVENYIETVDILEHDVELQVIHRDLLSDANAVDKVGLQIQAVEADDEFCVFTLGYNIGLTDLLPRHVMLKDEFPGMLDDVVRLSIVWLLTVYPVFSIIAGVT